MSDVGLLFTIGVDIIDCHTLMSAKGQVNMITFGGWCACDFFHGEILSGGCWSLCKRMRDVHAT